MLQNDSESADSEDECDNPTFACDSEESESSTEVSDFSDSDDLFIPALTKWKSVPKEGFLKASPATITSPPSTLSKWSKVSNTTESQSTQVNYPF